MINGADSIRYMNVLSRKYHFYYKDLYEVMEEFLNDIGALKVTVNGPVFYSINNVPMDEMVNAELFIPVVQNEIPGLKDMLFHSYYSIENMVSICVYGDFERNTEIAYKLLMEYMEEHGFDQATPIFHVLSGDKTLNYMFIKIGTKKLLA